MEFIRSSLLKDYTTATEVKKIDLPINPLSHLIISLDGYNVTDEATLAEIIAFINKITITHSGRAVVDLESEDLYGLDCYLYKRRPILTSKIATDNATRCLSLIVPFGRRIFDPEECYPGTRKGELSLSLDMTVPATSLDNSTLNIETVELVGAQPKRWLRSTVMTASAPGATGEHDVTLPIGNKIVAIQIWMTTFPATSSHTYGMDMLKVLLNNKEFGYSAARAMCLTGDMIFRVDGQDGSIAAQGEIQPDNIVWLDYDPRGNDQFLLDSAGASSLILRPNYGVNEAARVCVFELVDV